MVSSSPGVSGIRLVAQLNYAPRTRKAFLSLLIQLLYSQLELLALGKCTGIVSTTLTEEALESALRNQATSTDGGTVYREADDIKCCIFQVLGTDAGGTREIVDKNIQGLLHPVGRSGQEILAENIKFLLKNSTFRKQIGIKGREKVERLYLKRHMYKLLSKFLSESMHID